LTLRPRVVLASGNAHKARELARILTWWEVEPIGPLAFPEETGSTFAENARGKALFGRAHVPGDTWVAGEDSGIEVDALGGAPGIRSARFAGEAATDAENVALLLRELRDVPDTERTARYVCELVCLGPAGEETTARGTLEGAVARQPRGTGGFGYDPVFVPVGETLTVAELGDAWKAERSHRAQAARELAKRLGRSPEPL
jgi:XTP/dITP diphosphohydrolase